MALADDIINGTYDSNNYFNSNGKKKKKRTELADDIINGTYNPEDYFSTSKKSITNTTEDSPITIREKFTSSEEYRKLSEKASSPLANPMIKDLKKKMDNTINEYGDRPFNDKTIKEMNEKEGTWFKSSDALEDGFSIGGVLKTGISTIGDIGVNLAEGFLNSAEGLADWLQYRYADYNRVWGNDELADAIEKNAKTNSTRILLGDDSYGSLEEFFDKNSVLGEKSDSVANGVGQLLEQAGMYGLTGPAGTPGKVIEYGSIYASAAGSGQSSAYEQMDQRIEELEYLKNNTTDKEQQVQYQEQIDRIKNNYDDYAKNYGIISGLSESASEALFGGLGKVLKIRGLSNGTGLDEQLSKYLSSKVDNIIFKNAIELGIMGLAEGTEEVVSDFGQAIAEKLTYKSDEELLKLLQDQNYLEDFIIGSMTAWVGSAPKTYSATKNGRELSTGYTKNERQVLDSIEKSKVSNLQKEKTIEIETSKAVKELEQQQGGELSQKERDSIRGEIQQKVESGEIDINSQKLSKKEISEIQEEIENNMLDGKLNIEDIESALTSQETTQIRELQQRMSKTSNQQEKSQIEEQIQQLQNNKFLKLKESLKNDYNLQRTYYEANQKNVKFEYDSSKIKDNQKFTYESASKYLDNTTKSHHFVEKVANLSNDTGTSYGFINDVELKKLGHNIEGKQINGLVRVNKDGNSTILINVDSNKALNTIVGHETTHLLEGTKEYQELQTAIFEYSQSKKDYQKRLDNLNELYEGVENANVTNELTADLVGDYLFTDEQFINNLTSKPNLFGKIKKLIDDLVIRFKGTSEEKQFREVQKKFQKAYKNVTINLELDSTKYHLSDNALVDIDKVLNDINERNPVRLRDYTPTILVNNGIKDLPMYENPAHIRKNILTKNEAQQLGLKISSRDHYHGLGKDIYAKTIDSLDNPRVIFKRNNSNDYIILTTIKDSNNNNIIVPVEIETTTNVNNIKIDTNRIKTVYGYDISRPDLNDYIKYNLNNNEFTKIYEQKKERGTGISTVASSFTNNVSQDNNKVNPNDTLSITNNTQNNANYSLSTINEDIVPIKGDYQVYGEDIKYQEKHQIELQEYTPKLNLPVEMISSVNESTKREYTNDYSPLEKERIQKSTIDSKVERAIQKESFKAINVATKTAAQLADFTRKEKNQFREELRQFYGKTRSELTNVDTYRGIENIISKFANKEYDFIDYQIDYIKSEIANKSIKISHDLKYQLEDFVYFQKSNYGKLNFSDDGVDLQSLWRELSYDYPQYFSKDIKAERDILSALNEFVNQESAITEKYRLTTGDLSKIRDKVFNQLVNNSMDDVAIYDLQSELEAKANIRTRRIIQQELLDDMGITMDDLQIGNDINSIDLARTDPVRANEKIFGWEVGKKINDATVNRVKHNEAEATRWKNQERDEIKELGIKARSKESAAVQKYGEKEYLDQYGDYKKYGDRELEIEFPDIETQNKIKRAANVIKDKYDVYIDQINAVITDMGYDAIPKRKDYMRHFYEIDDKLSRWGVPFNKDSMNSDVLPTDINGITDEFKPGKTWFASAMERTGMKTTYDAITGIDGYLENAANLIFHTEDIQRYRTLSKLVRETYGKEHGLDNIDLMEGFEAEQRYNDIVNNKLSKYAAWLDEQANALAGKKGKIDRGLEEIAGRRIYNALNTLKSQVGSNMTGFNVRSSLTNFASAIQGLSKVNKISVVKGTISTLRNIVHDDGLIYKSDFLTNRFGSDNLSKKAWQKLSAAGQFLMSGTDYFTANQIWRSKYYEGLSSGLSENIAIAEADDFSARVMGDRTKGTTATIFNSKTLGLFTQFQLEVNNQWSNLIHDNKMDIQSGKKTGASVLFQLGQLFAASYLFNKLFEVTTGSSVMIDPIQLLMDIFNPDDNDEKTIIERAEESIKGFIEDNVPFISTFTGGRIPLSSALPIKELWNGEDQYGNKKDRKNILIEALPYYFLPTGYSQYQKTSNGLSMFDDNNPVKGSYTKGGNLKYPVEDTFSNRLQAGLFGKSANKNARDYYENNRKALKPKQVKEYKDLNMTIQDYWDYREGLEKARKVEDENGYVKYQNEDGNVYWYDKDEQVVYDSNYKEADIPITKLEKSSTMKQLYDYITNLHNVSSSQKEIMYNNVTSRSNTDQYGYQKYTNKEKSKSGKMVTKTYWYDGKNDILYNSDYEQVDKSKLSNMTKVSDRISLDKYDKYADFEEFDFATKNADKYDFLQKNNISFKDYNESEESREAYNWAYNNIDKYIVSKSITNNVVEYKKYTKDLSEIKGDVNNKGKTVSGSRQKKVVEYINNLDIDYGSKLILYKLEYASDKKSNNEIVDYLNNREDISYQEMVTILEELGMKVDNKGNVRW